MRRDTAKLAVLTRALIDGAPSLLVALTLVLSTGCQTFAPGALDGLTASRGEKRALKQAETDPFPSPADVGLEELKAKP